MDNEASTDLRLHLHWIEGLEDPQEHDVKIRFVNEKGKILRKPTITGHKCVLAALFPYFQTIFQKQYNTAASSPSIDNHSVQSDNRSPQSVGEMEEVIVEVQKFNPKDIKRLLTNVYRPEEYRHSDKKFSQTFEKTCQNLEIPRELYLPEDGRFFSVAMASHTCGCRSRHLVSKLSSPELDFLKDLTIRFADKNGHVMISEEPVKVHKCLAVEAMRKLNALYPNLKTERQIIVQMDPKTFRSMVDVLYNRDVYLSHENIVNLWVAADELDYADFYDALDTWISCDLEHSVALSVWKQARDRKIEDFPYCVCTCEIPITIRQMVLQDKPFSTIPNFVDLTQDDMTALLELFTKGSSRRDCRQLRSSPDELLIFVADWLEQSKTFSGSPDDVERLIDFIHVNYFTFHSIDLNRLIESHHLKELGTQLWQRGPSFALARELKAQPADPRDLNNGKELALLQYQHLAEIVGTNLHVLCRGLKSKKARICDSEEGDDFNWSSENALYLVVCLAGGHLEPQVFKLDASAQAQNFKYFFAFQAQIYSVSPPDYGCRNPKNEDHGIHIVEITSSGLTGAKFELETPNELNYPIKAGFSTATAGTGYLFVLFDHLDRPYGSRRFRRTKKERHITMAYFCVYDLAKISQLRQTNPKHTKLPCCNDVILGKMQK